jgi:hypothetical protein
LPTGSGDDEAKAEFCGLEIEEVAVAVGPSTRGEVIAETARSVRRVTV